jgi:Tol biopolymer transport system component
MHVGCSPRWATLSTYREGTPGLTKAFHGEIVLVDLTGTATATGGPSVIKQGTFRRIGHHHSSGSTYWSQPHAVESIDGKTIIFSSDMSGQPDVYAITIEREK